MIRRALELPYLVIVGALITGVLGVLSYNRLPADLLPTFTTPAVQIVTFYPGMPPVVMERDIMSRLERWTGQSVGIEHQEALAMLGVSVVKDFFREGISLDTAMSQVTSYAMSDMFYLPPGTIPPMVMPFDPTASVPLCLVSVSSETMSEKELYDVAYFELRNRLQSIAGVIAPAVYGGKLRRILAYVDREKLAARDMSPMDVVRSLHKQSVFVPAGNIKVGELDYQIFANAMPEKVAELNDVPIDVRDGHAVFMRDVASVQDSSQIQSNIVRINGRRQVYIPIYRQPGANTIQIVDAIRSQLTRIRARLREMDDRAQDLALEVVLDQSVYVRDSIAGLQLAAALGTVLAGIVVFLFLRSIGSTVVITLAIPLAIFAALFGLYLSDQTINSMTLGGLALAVGILVDQSIVVVENIVRHRSMGKEPLAAAHDGAREVAGPIVVSTITFIVVFFPVVFLSGMARFLFTPLALAASFAMTASLVAALTVVPSYCANLLGDTGATIEPTATAPPGWYQRMLAKALGKPMLVTLASALVAALCIGMLSNAGTELFPRVDAGQLQIAVRLPSGTQIGRTEQTVAAVEGSIIAELGPPDPEFPILEKYPESSLRMLISNIGVLMDWPAAYTPNRGPMDSFLLIQLKDRAGVDVFNVVERLRERLGREFPQAEFAFDTGGVLTAALNFGEPAPIHYQVRGSDLKVLGEIAAQVARGVAQASGTEDVRVMQRQDYPRIVVDIDRAKAALAGLTVEDVMHNLVTATNSSINFQPAFWIDQRNGNHYFIGAQYPEAQMESFDTIRDIPLTPAGGGKAVPLRTVATVRRSTGPSFVSHRNITRVFDIYANVAADHNLGITVETIDAQLLEDPALGLEKSSGDREAIAYAVGGTWEGRGYTVNASGEVQTMRTAFTQFGAGLLIAILLIYLVMVAQFRSFLDPAMIILTVPLGMIGVTFALLLTGTSLNIQSLMGIIMMAGIVVEYGIVLVDFANQRIDDGATPVNAIMEAARLRIRPILMTSLTTALAIAPMAMGWGGGEANAPLARTIIGGVLGATILSLFVLPCLYVLLKRQKAAPIQPAAIPET